MWCSSGRGHTAGGIWPRTKSSRTRWALLMSEMSHSVWRSSSLTLRRSVGSLRRDTYTRSPTTHMGAKWALRDTQSAWCLGPRQAVGRRQCQGQDREEGASACSTNKLERACYAPFYGCMSDLHCLCSWNTLSLTELLPCLRTSQEKLECDIN